MDEPKENDDESRKLRSASQCKIIYQEFADNSWWRWPRVQFDWHVGLAIEGFICFKSRMGTHGTALVKSPFEWLGNSAILSMLKRNTAWISELQCYQPCDVANTVKGRPGRLSHRLSVSDTETLAVLLHRERKVMLLEDLHQRVTQTSVQHTLAAYDRPNERSER